MEINSITLTRLALEYENCTKSGNNELLKVFDIEGNYIGITTRLLCHRLGLVHKVINCFIINENNEILLQTRKDKLIETYDLSFGGHIEINDKSTEASVLREAKEELNINLVTSNIEKIGKYKRYNYSNLNRPRDTNNEIRYVFIYRISDKEVKSIMDKFHKAKQSEAINIGWYKINDIIEIICKGFAFDGLQYGFYYLLKYLKND